MKLFISECNISVTRIVITIERILWLVMSFLNIIYIVETTLARGVRRGKKALINHDQLGRAS